MIKPNNKSVLSELKKKTLFLNFNYKETLHFIFIQFLDKIPRYCYEKEKNSRIRF